MTSWTVCDSSRSRIDRAGAAYRRGAATGADLAVAANWRSAHGYPLHAVTMLLWSRAKAIDPSALVAQRRKRLVSIVSKLQRESVRLSQMQDLGGCRAVVSTLENLSRLAHVFSRSPHVLSTFDYINSPKDDGYRSVHYVYKYKSRNPRYAIYDGYLIEVQLRTRLQHAWATALETIDIVTRQSLKAGAGTSAWKRFFSLMGAEMAHQEECPTVPSTPVDERERRAEIRQLDAELRVGDLLLGLSTTVETLATAPVKDAGIYVLTLDFEKRRTSIEAFTLRQRAQAEERVLKAEAATLRNPSLLVVPVSVASIERLHDAYPSYYLDAKAFFRCLRQATDAAA